MTFIEWWTRYEFKNVERKLIANDAFTAGLAEEERKGLERAIGIVVQERPDSCYCDDFWNCGCGYSKLNEVSDTIRAELGRCRNSDNGKGEKG